MCDIPCVKLPTSSSHLWIDLKRIVRNALKKCSFAAVRSCRSTSACIFSIADRSGECSRVVIIALLSLCVASSSRALLHSWTLALCKACVTDGSNPGRLRSEIASKTLIRIACSAAREIGDDLSEQVQNDRYYNRNNQFTYQSFLPK